MEKIAIVRLAGNGKTLLSSEGRVVRPPASWSLLPPGDAGVTRRVKAAGPHWLVQEKRGKRTYSKGIWAATTTIERVKSEMESERQTPQYQKKLQASRQRRARQEQEYVREFAAAILNYLRFASRYRQEAAIIAQAVAQHATPVGSGTVARTSRIPVEKRAEAAVIAWMRHKTTSYDQMHIARVKGKRRQVRRELAHDSVNILTRYRQGVDLPEKCPLLRAISSCNKDIV